MSLKAFHIFFIAVSLLLAFGVGGCSLWQYSLERQSGQLVLGLVGVAGGVALIFYLRVMWRKLRPFDLI